MLACDEAFANLVHYGCSDCEDDEISIKLEIRQNEVQIIVSDHGVPFDPTQVDQPDLTAPIEDRQVGGLGIYFIKKTMDKTEYWIDETGNHLLMSKKIS
jgi:anti-sigma regulatory factor (Ser/Thr protein kinase)